MNQTRIKVKDVMKSNVDFVDGMKTVSDALEEMQHVETKALIVKRRDENDEWGMVLLSDIARKVLAHDKSAQRTNIYEIMSKPVLTIDQDMDIRYCARLFNQFKLSRAPVIHEKKIVGIISLTDMVLKGLCTKT